MALTVADRAGWSSTLDAMARSVRAMRTAVDANPAAASTAAFRRATRVLGVTWRGIVDLAPHNTLAATALADFEAQEPGVASFLAASFDR